MRGASLALLCAAVALCACGYRPLRSARAERLAVVLAGSRIADATVEDEVVAGAREELARHGMLRAGGAYPRVEIEILRTDEQSGAVRRVADDRAQAGAVSEAVVARAWIRASPGAEPAGDTGDMRRDAFSAVASSPEVALLSRGDALRSVARALGHALGKRLAGDVVVTDEP